MDCTKISNDVPTGRELKRACEDVEFPISKKLCSDVKNIILSYLPYDMKDTLMAIMEEKNEKLTEIYENYIEAHIGHYEPHNFVWEEYDRKDKELICRIPMMDGEYNGKSFYWYKNWEIDCTYKNGVKHGFCEENNYDRCRVRIYRCKNGKIHGQLKEYKYDEDTANDFDKDILVKELNFINGVLHGKCEIWGWVENNAHVVCNYNNGKLDGLLTEWWNGTKRKQAEYTYKNGVLHGLYREWYVLSVEIGDNPQIDEEKDFQLRQEVTFVDGKEEGVMRRWHKNGNLYIEAHYKNGKRGEYWVYRANGKLKEYNDGMPNENNNLGLDDDSDDDISNNDTHTYPGNYVDKASTINNHLYWKVVILEEEDNISLNNTAWMHNIQLNNENIGIIGLLHWEQTHN